MQNDEKIILEMPLFTVGSVSRFRRIDLLLLFLGTFAASYLGAESPREPAAPTGVAEALPPASCSNPADSATRKLFGVVTDQSGANIAQAQLTLACGDFRATATTDATGSYTLTAPAGKYLLSITAASFGAVSQSVSISGAEAGTKLNPVLHIGPRYSSVTVNESTDNAFVTTMSSSGTKTDLPLVEVPQAITIVNRDLMDEQNVVKLDDALKNVAGVIAGGYYDGWDFYRIRGFDSYGYTFIDGLRGGNGLMEETWGLETIEVLKGPSSGLYGQSPLGGIVNLVTRKPVDANFAHLQVTTGSYNYVDPALDAGHVFNKAHTLYGRMDALYHSADTFVDYTHRNRYYFAPSITWRPSPSTYLTLMGRAERDYGRQAMPLPAVGTVLPNLNGKIARSLYIGELKDNANKLSQGNQQIGYQFQQGLGKIFTLRQNARFSWYQQHWNRIYYPAYLGTDNRTLYRYPLDWTGPWQTHEVDTNAEARGRFWKMDHEALLGFDMYRNAAHSNGSYGLTDEPLDLYHPVYGANPTNDLTPYSNTHTVTQYAGIYLQDHIRFQHNVTLTAGGRLDLAKNESMGSANQNGRGWTPRVGLTWLAIPSTTLYANFSKSYLPQSDMVYNGTTGGSYIAPERGIQWEGGAKSSFLNGHVTGSLAVFQLNRKNVATTDPSHPNYYLVTGEQRSRGIEFETALHPMTGWNVTAAYSYDNAEVLHDTTVTSGTPTINAPKNILSAWTNYELPRTWACGLGIGFGGRHYTDQGGDTSNSFQLPGYGLLDGSLSFHRGRAKWQVNANNLTSKYYASGSYSNLYVKPGEPRTIRATLAWNF